MTPSERLRAHLAGITPERLAEIDRRAEQPGEIPPESDTHDDPDPFGRGWGWLYDPESLESELAGPVDAGTEGGESRGDVRGGPGVVEFEPAKARWPRRKSLVWVGGLAASIAMIAMGSWIAFSRGPLAERDVTAWVTQKLVPGPGGIRIAAPAGDDEKAEEPLIRGFDRARDAVAPSSPNIYAPLRIQEQLVVPEVSPASAPGQATRRPVRSVAESVSPGDIFYLEFTTASTPSPGSAVVLSSRGGSWRLLRDEVAVTPSDGTGYFGPIKMEDAQTNYYVVLADRTATPLLTTASRVAATLGDATFSPEILRETITAALQASGHNWYGIQRIEVRLEQGKLPNPKLSP